LRASAEMDSIPASPSRDGQHRIKMAKLWTWPS